MPGLQGAAVTGFARRIAIPGCQFSKLLSGKDAWVAGSRRSHTAPTKSSFSSNARRYLGGRQGMPVAISRRKDDGSNCRQSGKSLAESFLSVYSRQHCFSKSINLGHCVGGSPVELACSFF